MGKYEIIKIEEKKEIKNRILNKIYLIQYYYKIKKIIKKLKLSKYDEIFGLDHTLLGNFFVGEKFNLLEEWIWNEKLGLMKLFTQLLAYLNLAEMGVAGASAYALYRPLADNNYKEISIVMSTIIKQKKKKRNYKRSKKFILA